MTDDMAALIPVLLVFAALIACALFWCLLSSCLGTPILQSVSNLWEYMLLSARSGGDPTLQARRRAAGRFSQAGQEWEMMDYRRDRDLFE
ncbi:hypothetical protein B0H17DRAFT_353687 [Mycena rosella]|uniref:Uncharacterized protein n=1 Tax=Mycena rosella TaxID=1033263 RepID=A0AAD7G1F5_MYCRO|nr:hypothetical protein B0H17DRAFT_353687 [Mycena rosella]